MTAVRLLRKEERRIGAKIATVVEIKITPMNLKIANRREESGHRATASQFTTYPGLHPNHHF